MVPAQQRLQAAQLAAGQADDRLVDHGELARIEGGPQRSGQRQPGVVVGVPVRIVDGPVPGAFSAGPVQGPVSRFDQIRGPGPGRRPVDDPDAGGHAHPVPAEAEGLLDPGQYLAGQRHRGFASAGIRHEQDELVSADPGHGRRRPGELGFHSVRDRREKLVPDIVAQVVVDRLESVEVEEADTDALTGTDGIVHRRGEPVEEQRPVGQAGQRVMPHLVGKLGAEDGLRVGQGALAQGLDVTRGHRFLNRAGPGAFWPVPGPGGMAGDDGEAAAERVHVHEIRPDQGRADIRRPARLERNLAGDRQHPDRQGVQHFGQCGGAREAVTRRGEHRDPFVREHNTRVPLRGRFGWAAPRAFPALLVHVGSCRTRVTLIRSARSPCGYPLDLITFGS